MSEFERKLLDAKAAIQNGKTIRQQEVQDVRAKILGVSDLYSEHAKGPSVSELAAPNAEQWDLAPVVETVDNVSKHSDGTYSVIDESGKTHGGLTKRDANEFAVWDRANIQGIMEGAPADPLMDSINRVLGHGAVGLGEQVAASAIEGYPTLNIGVERYNKMTRGFKENEKVRIALGGKVVDRPEITEADVEFFKGMQGARDDQLSSGAHEFKKTPVYAELAKLQEQVNKYQGTYTEQQETADAIRKEFPVNRADDAAMEQAYKDISEDEGHLSAMLTTIMEKPGTLLSMGVESVPYMVAFTVGGPVAQTVILTTMASGKGAQLTQQFVDENDREPTSAEQGRIDAWAAVSTVAEKFGDMAAVKAIPIARIGRVKKLQTAVKHKLPKSLRFLLAGGAALGGEGLSGAITESAEQMALEGEVGDLDKVAYAAFTEAMATPGGLGAMVAGKGLVKGTAGITKTILGTDTNTATVAPEVPSEVDHAAEAEALAKGTEIDQEEFDERLKTIDPENITDPAETLKTLYALGRRKLTDEQWESYKVIKEAVVANLSEVAAPKDTEMGSIQNIEQLTEKDLMEIYRRVDTNRGDKNYIRTVLEARKLEAELVARDKAAPKTAREVHEDVTAGATDRWTGFQEYVKQIKAILADPEETDIVIRDRKAASIVSQMETHAGNMRAKLNEIQIALKMTPEAEGHVIIIRGNRVDFNSLTNRTMEYVAESVPRSEYIADRKDGKYVNLISERNSTKLIKLITQETEYGEKMVEMIKGYNKTSFGQIAQKSATYTAQLNEVLDTIEKQEIETTSPELTEEDIGSIGSADATPVAAEPVTEEAPIDEAPPVTSVEDYGTVTEAEAAAIGQDIEVTPETEPVPTILEGAKTFLAAAINAFPKVGNAKTEVSAKIAGKTLVDLIKVATDPGIQMLADEVFQSKATLADALEQLGISSKSAKILATRYKKFATAYSKLILDEQFPDGTFAIRQPLSMLYRDDTGRVPPQVVFAMMASTASWVQQNPNNNVFRSNSDRERFLYSTQGSTFVGNDLEQLENLGYSYKIAANSIGANAIRMLRISAKNTESSIFYDNLITAMGMAALEAGQTDYTIETHTWKFTEDAPGRTFKNGTQFKHIRLNETVETKESANGETYEITKGVSFSKAENKAIDEATDILNKGVETESEMPLQEPSKIVITSIRNSFGGVSKSLKKTLKKLQNVAWTASETLGVFEQLATSHREVLDTLVGIVPIDEENDHEKTQQSLKAANEDKIVAIDSLLAASEGGFLKKLYFKYGLMNQNRIMMQGKINPQASHITRYLLKAFDTTTYNKENIHLFKFAVVANLGFSVDKAKPTKIADTFDEYYEDQTIQAAIKAIREDNIDKLAKVLPEVQSKFGGDASILNALTALAKYEVDSDGKVKSFKSDIIVEIDGVTNGFAMNVLQFPLFGDRETLERRLNQTGTYLGKTKAETTHLLSGIFKSGDALDVYLDLGAQVRMGATKDVAIAYYKDRDIKFDLDNYNDKNAALEQLYITLADTTARDLVKYPFMIFQYGGGITSISRGVAKDIIDDIYRQIGDLQKGYKAEVTADAKVKYIEEMVKPFHDRLQLLGVKTSIPKAIRLGKANIIKLDEKALTNEIGNILAPRFEHGLSSMLGETKEVRDAVVQGGEALHAIFTAHYNVAYAEVVKAVGHELTTREINELVRDKLIHILPQYKGPLMEMDEAAFIDLSKQGTVSESSKNLDAVEYAYNPGDGKKKLRTSEPTRKEFVAPGVSALIRMIINMDASLMQDSLDQHSNVLTLYDAVMGDPATLMEISKRYGEQYLAMGRKHSVMESINDQLKAAIEASDQPLLREANSWLKDNAFNNSDELVVNIEYATTVVNDAATKVADARTDLEAFIKERGGIVSHQMNMVDMEVTNEDAIASSLDVARGNNEKVTETAADDLLSEEDTKTIKDEMLSLDGIKRSNITETHSGSITGNNVKKLLKQFTSVSRGYYDSVASMNSHTEVLETLMKALARGIDEGTSIKLTVEQIDGITQGGYENRRNKMRISLSRQAPPSANGQSSQEVFVHELLHALTTTALKDSPLVTGQIRKLYKQVKAGLDANGKHAVFLAGIANPTAADIAAAQVQYNYLFYNPKNEANKLAEFLAYATTNKALVSYLKNEHIKLPVRDSKLLGRLLEFVDKIIDTFIRALQGRSKNDAYQDMIAVVEQLIAIQHKHETRFDRISGKLVKNFDKSDDKIRQTLARQSERLIKTDTNNKLRKVSNAVIGGAAIHLSSNAVTAKVTRRVHGMLNATLRSLVSEIGEGVLTKALVKQLLVVKNHISKARQETERDFLEWFDDIWKSVDPEEISAETRKALTSVMLRTDLSSLLGIKMSPARIIELMNNDKLIRMEQRALLNRMNLKTTDRAIRYADELGEHLASGNTWLNNGHTNVYTILKDEIKEAVLKANPDMDKDLNAYVTLVALQKTDSRQRSLVKQLGDSEFAAEPNDNGMIDILKYHIEFSQSSIEELFDGNPFQTYKGWIIERVDNLHSMKTGTAADAPAMIKAGYTQSYALGAIPGVSQVHDTLYVSHHMPEVPYVSGIMSVTSQRHMGTSLTEMFSNDPSYQNNDNTVDYKKIRKSIRRVIRNEKAGAKNLSANDKLKLRPIRDENGVITDYRVMMNNQVKDELLQPDLAFQNVFAHMHSSFVDKKNTVISDKKTIDLLVHEQVNLMGHMPERFINILDPQSPYHDRYRRLPREVRIYFDQYVVGGKFMVREDIVDKVFGYTAKDASNLAFLQGDSRARMKWGIRMAHYLVKQTVSYGMDRVVIGTTNVVAGNLLSNLFQLSMRKISPIYVIRKMYEGYQEYKVYQADADRLRFLRREIDAKKLDPKTSSEGKEYFQIRTRMEGNKIHRMSAAGLNSLIVEDLNDAASDGYFKRLQKTMKAERYAQHLDKVPNSVGTVARTLFMTRSSLPYRMSKKVVQLSDFLARYVMIEHATTVKGQNFDSAMHEAVDAFVLFDENMTPVLEAINSVGGTLFMSYWMRNQRAAKNLIKRSPTAVMTSAGIQHVTGIDTLANINSSFYGFDFSPNLFQLDDALDKATDITLLTNF